MREKFYRDSTNTLKVVASGEAMIFTEYNTRGGWVSVRLHAKEDLRALRDQINEHLGEKHEQAPPDDRTALRETEAILDRLGPAIEAESRKLDAMLARLREKPETKPLPVGTIVCGEGLTEAQRERPISVNKVRDVISALSSAFAWADSAEGVDFWIALVKRLQDMARAARAEEDRKSAQAPFTLYGIKLDATKMSDGVDSLTLNLGSTTQCLSPAHARQLADALTRHADAIEKRTPAP